MEEYLIELNEIKWLKIIKLGINRIGKVNWEL